MIKEKFFIALGTVGVNEVVALILLPTVMAIGKVIKAANRIMSGSYEVLASMGNSNVDDDLVYYASK